MGLEGDQVIPKACIVTRYFNNYEQNGYLPPILSRQIWEKSGVEGELVTLQFFGYLEIELELLISVRMSRLSIF
jgi:hypothetical protein